MPSRPRPGEWRALALDVGQASAVLIITHQQAMLFDAGGRSANRDDGERIVLPVLRALGVRKLDTVVISHEDRDHIGGLAAILRQVLVSRLVGAPSHAALVNGGAQPGHSEVDNLARQHPPGGPAHSACHRGLTWEMDKVRIEVLHPEQPFNQSASSQQKIRRNHHSCVISVSGQYHSILLTGDITAREESRLVAAGMTRADVVLAPHHGSDTSSSPAWVNASGAKHVIVQSGWLNRFGHPAIQVVMRWRNAGAELWRTDRHGAIWVQSQEEGLHVIPMRRIRRRYWHFDD